MAPPIHGSRGLRRLAPPWQLIRFDLDSVFLEAEPRRTTAIVEASSGSVLDIQARRAEHVLEPEEIVELVLVATAPVRLPLDIQDDVGNFILVSECRGIRAG